jgi:hypothetical protein
MIIGPRNYAVIQGDSNGQSVGVPVDAEALIINEIPNHGHYEFLCQVRIMGDKFEKTGFAL